jgi:hypothetical protein
LVKLGRYTYEQRCLEMPGSKRCHSPAVAAAVTAGHQRRQLLAGTPVAQSVARRGDHCRHLNQLYTGAVLGKYVFVAQKLQTASNDQSI